MFRPEMLEPMGFPKDVHVHGWGISLERPTMIRCGPIPARANFTFLCLTFEHYANHQNLSLSLSFICCVYRYGINNIRTLVGHKVPIESVEKSPAVRF
jgi:phenylalanyl-tRNA synthetase alpha chain